MFQLLHYMPTLAFLISYDHCYVQQCTVVYCAADIPTKSTTIFYEAKMFIINFLQLVIGNMLQTRRQRVVFVTSESTCEISLTREQMHSGIEIEDLIVSNVIISHSNFISTHKY